MFMSEFSDRDRPSTSPFTGLTPSRTAQDSRDRCGGRHLAARDAAPSSKTLFATMPVLLVGALAISSLGLAPVATAPRADQRGKSNQTNPRLTAAITAGATTTATEAGVVSTASVIVPSSYVVRPGDSVSAIAGRYGLSTAAILALNGLGWKSLIFPRQVLRLTSAAPAPAAPVAAAPHATPPVATTPAAPTASPASQASSTYTILRGDTITAIARKFGVTIAAVLSANGLSASSIIYAGRTLVIPGAGLAPAQVGPVTVVPSSSSSAQANAQVIISVGRSLGVPDYGIVIALAAAEQESSLQNLHYGDRDSVGLFQQRPSAGWGTVAQLTTPSYAAALFYGGPHNPNKGKTRGLLDIPGWQSMTVTEAAQAVQNSAAPNAYAKWEATARALLAQLG
jgi:LysM repeat protein